LLIANEKTGGSGLKCMKELINKECRYISERMRRNRETMAYIGRK
jgi:hypothetical protein